MCAPSFREPAAKTFHTDIPHPYSHCLSACPASIKKMIMFFRKRHRVGISKFERRLCLPHSLQSKDHLTPKVAFLPAIESMTGVSRPSRPKTAKKCQKSLPGPCGPEPPKESRTAKKDATKRGVYKRKRAQSLGLPGQVWEFRFLPSFPSFLRENSSSKTSGKTPGSPRHPGPSTRHPRPV